ncbi:protein SODIUM POTASSIUM ROOT defective [Sesamum alatum]|uniref:Protein SODIUM POTASSIUM ROOT defective n=1 Tax=Sesamum alatum TaxID=300844 RepID=A0AAE1Z2V8_9LAMI|nr:protein SODIUM POTASSIUM ROOT defective [Sesamum alatum]
MKSIELFCASPASTAICSSMNQRAIIRPGMRPIDRQIHRLGDPPRTRTNAAPCSSQLPFDPSCRPFYHKSRKNTTSAKETEILRRKSSADVHDLASPPTSSRYLLSDRPFLDPVSDSERALVSSHPLLRDNNYNYKRLNLDDFRAFRSLSSRAAYETPVYNPAGPDKPQARKSSPQRLSDHLNKSSSNRRTVELRVSIHCKGCEGKLRKHISRMEGKSEFIQYRFSNKKGDSNRGRDPSRGTCQHFQGEECPILAISDFIFVFLVFSKTQSHKDKLIKFIRQPHHGSCAFLVNIFTAV